MDDPQDSTNRYRAIFDLCDDDKDGFIDVEHFKELAKTHSAFGAEGLSPEVVTGVIHLLDPEGKGLISFEHFSRGVTQILELQQGHSSRFNSTSSESIDCPLTPDLLNITDKPFAGVNSAIPTDVPGVCNGLINSSNHHKTNHAGNTQASSGDSIGELTGIQSESATITPQLPSTVVAPTGSEDERDSVISGRSSEITENSHHDGTDEESYEALGEVESEADVSDPGLTPVTPRKRGEKKDLLSSRSPKKPCLAHLSPRAGTPTSTGHSSGEEIFDNIDDNFQELHSRVKQLEGQLLHLTKDQVDTKSKQVKLKDDNSVLVSRVIFLEEQLRDMELQSHERITEERRSHQDHMARRDREKSEEVDYVMQRLHNVEGEYEKLKEETARLRQEISRLRSEKIELQERMLEKQEMYNVLYDDNEQLKGEYHKQEDLHQKERRSTGQLVDELRKELEDLRKYKQEIETGLRLPGGSVSELPGRYLELQSEIHKLKAKNQLLQDSNEDLNAQLVTRCVEEGKSLLQDGETKSLAEELDHLTKEELMQKLSQEQEYNQRLKQYVDRMLLTILEKNPSILEISHTTSEKGLNSDSHH